MELSKSRFEKYLFVCENERSDGTCCMPLGTQIRERLKQAVKERGLSDKIRVSRAGCLDLCANGPSVLLMPDNKWFKTVSVEDCDKILERAVKGL